MTDERSDFILLAPEGVHHLAVVGDAAGGLWCDLAAVASATGWAAKEVGLCRGDVCIPTGSLVDDVDDGGRIELGRFASLTGQLVVADAGRRVVAVGPGAAVRGHELQSAHAPGFELPDLDGRPHDLADWAGRKKLVVSFASWCGCAHDLPGWQEMADELGPAGLSVVAVAIDEDPEAVRPFTDGVTYPVLIDRDRTFTDAWGIVNVPTVVWLDEDDRVVRPNDVAFGTETFREFTKVDSRPHHEALRRWVLDGEEPLSEEEAAAARWTPTDEHQRARLHFRMGLHLWRAGDLDGATEHFDRATELAPWDFTIRRAQLPLLGKDPFLGEDFLRFYQEWDEAGRPRYGQSTGPMDG